MDELEEQKIRLENEKLQLEIDKLNDKTDRPEPVPKWVRFFTYVQPLIPTLFTLASITLTYIILSRTKFFENANTLYEYKNLKLKDEQKKLQEDSKDSKDYFTAGKTYPTYLDSPSGKQTLWSDERDGKNVLQVGGTDAKNGTQIAQ